MEGTRFPLQCARLSERPTLLLMCLYIFAEHEGVMVDLVAHCLPPAIILGGGGAIWGLESPFLVTLGTRH